ncbi:MAG: WbuC family cupin fold metalloprotein [Gammaproteobacteria bacterium]|nr:WbuC family cupin fold metalloprotein [Gammaproteobacteria bacterium]
MKLLPEGLLDELAARAAVSPRRRAHHTLHAGAADLVQRFIVSTCADTYFRPHRHAARSELALILRGRFEIVTFDAAGTLTARHAVGAGSDSLGYETPAGTWHTVLALEDGAAFLEVKEGPYDPATAAEFAAWAPAEGATEVPRFAAWLRRARPGERFDP